MPTTLSRPGTVTGIVRSTLSPRPSWPEPFSPQQRTVLLATSAQVWASPAATATAGPGGPSPAGGGATVVGTTRLLVSPRATPSWPLPLLPQAHRAVRAHRAGVIAAGRDITCGESATAAQHRCRRGVEQGRVADAELTKLVITPALRRTVGEQGTGMGIAGGHGNDVQQTLRYRRDTGEYRDGPSSSGAVADLAPAIVARAQDVAARTKQAGVIPPCRDAGDPANVANRQRSSALLRSRTDAELAGVVATPTARVAIGQLCARVFSPGRDSNDVGERSVRTGQHRTWRRKGAADRAPAQLAEEVLPPASHLTGDQPVHTA